MNKIELNESEQSLIYNILGYLNFSSGSFDAQFATAWNNLYELLSAKGCTTLWSDSLSVLRSELLRLEKLDRAFSDSTQAKSALSVVEKALTEYLKFHEDTLFSLEDSYLFNSLFMARVCRVVVANDPVNASEATIRRIIEQLSDFLGYRPIPILEGGEKHEPNLHEWIAPLPLYYEGVGCAFGNYKNIIEITIDILYNTDADILRDASFIPQNLKELSVDPRAYDFDHPANRRLNYSFGTWDDRCIDKDGYYRRFIVHRTTLDAIMSRVWNEKDSNLRKEYEYEAASVLAGTILMASGICGGHVQTHDSTVTLRTLAPTVAAYRDLFYERLIQRAPASLKPRLEEEARQLFQPFAGVRQYLNRYLAQKRADQLQRFSLARTYARMGYFEASKRQTDVIETTASRLLSQIDCFITRAHLYADDGKIDEGAACLPQIESLLRRGLACGAFPDPWFILGFDAQFNLFPSVEDGVHDHRLDGLIDLLNDVFDLYSRLQKEAAAQGNSELRLELSDKMSGLADWWDQFGSAESSSVEGFSGQAAWESAAEVSRALAVWSQAGKAVGDVAFWKRHVERFTSPKAFVLLCEALLDKGDLVSSSSLLIYWLNQSETIPLMEGDYSFHSIVFDWMEQVWRIDKGANVPSSLRRRNIDDFETELSVEEYLKRWNSTIKFLDYFGENADSYWSIPTLELPREKFDRKIEFKTDNPVIAELSRRLILASRYLGKTPAGIAKISLKPSFKDAALAVDAQNLPTPEEFKQFYNDNREVFPKYISFFVFMQIILNEVRMPAQLHSFYRRAIFGDNTRTFTVSSTKFDPSAKQGELLEKSISEENVQTKKRLWDALIQELSKNGDVTSFQDLIDRILKEVEDKTNQDNKQSFSSPSRESLVSIEKVDDDLEDGDYEEFAQSYSDEIDDLYDDEDNTITGGDPTFSAAYENMIFRDTADDGIDDETAEGKSSFNEQSEDFIFARETDRVSERLTFIFSTAKLWKFAAGRSPLLTHPSNQPLDDSVIADTRLRLEEWRNQALKFEQELYELLDQASRYHIPQPSGTTDSLVEYDQLRGTKEILIDRIIWTIVEVEDVIVFLKATLRDETSEKYAKPWKTLALETFSAIFRRDVKRVRALWPQLLAKLETETLLYIPTARGGDAKAIVESRRLQQVVLCLLRYAPRLGLLLETFQLIGCVQKMEQIRLSSPGSVTEYDRLVETAARSLTETLASSSKNWRVKSNSTSFFANQDEALVYYLITTTDVILKSWLSHSQQIRISSLEAIATNARWTIIQQFIIKYGSDLFTQDFLAFRNIRAILHQGASNYLTSLISMKKENRDLENGERIVSAILEGKENIDNVAGILELILECVAENYMEYVDYNSTTTQSDRGEKLYTLLDFLRVLTSYERISWNLKPVYWTHDSLIRAGRSEAAALWKERVKQKSSGLAENSLREYTELSKRYGIWLQSIHERLKERFVRPLDVAQMCGLVYDAITEVRKSGEQNPVFEQLEKEVESFAETPSGVGFELPDWLTQLQDEVILSRVDSKEERRERDPKEDPFESIPFLPVKKMSRSDVDRQLQAALKDPWLGGGLFSNK